MRKLLVSGKTKTLPVIVLIALVLIILTIRFGPAKPPAPGGISFTVFLPLLPLLTWNLALGSHLTQEAITSDGGLSESEF